MWFPLALLYALVTSIQIPVIKNVASRTNSISFIFLANLFIIPCMIFTMLLLEGVPSVSSGFVVFMLLASTLDTLAYILTVWAFSNSSLSLVVPISAFHPVFVMLTGTIFLNEIPTPLKLLGILVIVAGAYLLNITNAKEGLFTPFKKLYQVKGVKYFLLANLIWSITPIFQKKAILETTPHSPTFVATIGTILISLYVLPIILRRKDKILASVNTHKYLLILGGILVTIQQFSLQSAYLSTNIGYVAAIGKLSIVFGVLWGWLIFKETRIRERLLGALVMIVGTIMMLI